VTEALVAEGVYVGGAVRVASYDPTLLPLFAADGEEPSGRFDDPRREFRVRYAAHSVRGCLVELMSQWRPSASEVVARARAFKRSEFDIAPQWLDPAVPKAWLSQQYMVEFRAVRTTSIFDLPGNLADLSNDERIAELVVSGFGDDQVLDVATVMMAGPAGRRVSQQVARSVYERQPRPDGIHFRSRFDPDELCWALYSHCAIDWKTSARSLSSEDNDDRAAVKAAAAVHGLAVPQEWR